MGKHLRRLLSLQQSGLILIILALGFILTLKAGTHVDHLSGRTINDFLNPYTLMQMATDSSTFAIMAAGGALVIISGGIDLSVGSIYALCGVLTALALRKLGPMPMLPTILIGATLCIGCGLLCGLLNGIMVVGLRVHPFIITLGTMWILRGIAFVGSKAESILLPQNLTDALKATFGLGEGLYPVPLVIMILVTIAGALYLTKTVMGRHIFAVGGNTAASLYAGLRIGPILIGVYGVSGLCAGIAAFVGSGYYGSASCADGTGYELYVIAAAVVGGASLIGGRGSVFGATLGAILIVLIRQSIRTLQYDQNYEWIIVGCAIVIAVVLDQLNTRLSARRLVRQSAAPAGAAPPPPDLKT